MRVTATDAKNRFGYYLAQAEREPVHVLKNDRVAGVIVSAARYAELEALERDLAGNYHLLFSLGDAPRTQLY